MVVNFQVLHLKMLISLYRAFQKDFIKVKAFVVFNIFEKHFQLFSNFKHRK